MRDLNDRAVEARDKKADIGSDIDLSAFQNESLSHVYLEDLKALSDSDRKQMILAGIDTQDNTRSGTFIQKDSAVIHAHSKQDGLEVIPIREALEPLLEIGGCRQGQVHSQGPP